MRAQGGKTQHMGANEVLFGVILSVSLTYMRPNAGGWS